MLQPIATLDQGIYLSRTKIRWCWAKVKRARPSAKEPYGTNNEIKPRDEGTYLFICHQSSNYFVWTEINVSNFSRIVIVDKLLFNKESFNDELAFSRTISVFKSNWRHYSRIVNWCINYKSNHEGAILALMWNHEGFKLMFNLFESIIHSMLSKRLKWHEWLTRF